MLATASCKHVFRWGILWTLWHDRQTGLILWPPVSQLTYLKLLAQRMHLALGGELNSVCLRLSAPSLRPLLTRCSPLFCRGSPRGPVLAGVLDSSGRIEGRWWRGEFAGLAQRGDTGRPRSEVKSANICVCFEEELSTRRPNGREAPLSRFTAQNTYNLSAQRKHLTMIKWYKPWNECLLGRTWWSNVPQRPYL